MEARGTSGGLALLVEDDGAVRAVLAILLEQDGWRVEQASDGREGCELARRLKPQVIVTDLSMPHMTGIEMARRLTELDGRGPPLVAITADESGLLREAEESGLFTHVVHKPLDPARFLGIVRSSANPLRSPAEEG